MKGTPTRCPVCWQRIETVDLPAPRDKDGREVHREYDPDWMIARHVRRVHESAN